MRVVLDTNQLVAALMRPPELATVLMAWDSARFTVLASDAILDEYFEVLAYPTIAPLISPELLRTFKDNLLHDIVRIEPIGIPSLCRDPDDDKFIAAAAYGAADYLVTVDKHLLAHEVVDYLTRLGVGILDSDALIRLLDQRG